MIKGTNQYEANEASHTNCHQRVSTFWFCCVPIATTTTSQGGSVSHMVGPSSGGGPVYIQPQPPYYGGCYQNSDISHVTLKCYAAPQPENYVKCSRALLQQNGQPSKILLFPEEGWARSASSSYWTLTPYWWSRSRCKVVEVAGTRRFTTKARLIDNGNGALYVLGSFKRMSSDCDFKLFLTSNVSTTDYNMGYCMTGTLERGSKKTNTFQMTHFAVIRRNDYDVSKM